MCMKKKSEDCYDRKRPKFEIVRAILGGLGAAFAVFLGVLYLTTSPELQSFRNSLAYQLIVRLAITLPLVYFTWFHPKKPKKPPLIGRLLSTALILTVWLPLLIESPKINILFNLTIFWGLLGYILYRYSAKGESYAVLYAELLGMVFWLIGTGNDYTFVNASHSLHFWQWGLVLALIGMGVTVFFLCRHKIRLKDNRLSEKLGLVFAVGFAVFVFCTYTAYNLNYALDFSDPVIYTVEIEEKDIVSGYKQSTRHSFTFTIEGKTVKLNIPKSDYYAYEVGDVYTVKCYEGAFGDNFYLNGT